MSDQRLKKLAEVIVHYSTEVKPGDKVYIRTKDAAMPYMVEVAKEAIKKGAFVQYVVTIPEISEALLKYGNDDQISQTDELFEKCVTDGDVWITAWGSKNTRIFSNIDPQKIQLNRLAQKEPYQTYYNRMGSGELRWCGTQFPTEAEAQEAEMSLSEYEDFVYEAGLLDKKDPVAEWKRVEQEQEKWVKYLDGKKELHIVSKGTDITVHFEGRKWVNCCGKLNFPDGEIFTSPIEDQINGHITFTFPAVYDGKMVENVYMEVKDGKVVKATASKGEDLLLSLLDSDEGARRFGEVAIGTNYNIKKFTKNILFDEKIGGTIHMAVGNSILEAGGKNTSAIHWDMICDMREGGKIYADGELFYENGAFINDVLKKNK